MTLRPEARPSTPITGVMLSPDGSLLLTVSGRGQKHVAVRDVAGSQETVLLDEPSSTCSFRPLAAQSLSWARNDTVLVNSFRPDRGTLIVLDREAVSTGSGVCVAWTADPRHPASWQSLDHHLEFRG